MGQNPHCYAVATCLKIPGGALAISREAHGSRPFNHISAARFVAPPPPRLVEQPERELALREVVPPLFTMVQAPRCAEEQLRIVAVFTRLNLLLVRIKPTT